MEAQAAAIFNGRVRKFIRPRTAFYAFACGLGTRACTAFVRARVIFCTRASAFSYAGVHFWAGVKKNSVLPRENAALAVCLSRLVSRAVGAPL